MAQNVVVAGGSALFVGKGPAARPARSLVEHDKVRDHETVAVGCSGRQDGDSVWSIRRRDPVLLPQGRAVVRRQRLTHHRSLTTTDANMNFEELAARIK